jgi:large subunit ribosomal protein L30
MAKKIRITLIKSGLGALPLHRRTIEALGFKHPHQALEKTDTPQLRGMIRQVRHLVRVEEAK